MNNFSICANGHYFDPSLYECPYCPKTVKSLDSGESSNKTILNDTEKNISTGFSKTQILNVGIGGSDESKSNSISLQEEIDFSRTYISGTSSSGVGDDSDKRKLVAWLVSYSIHPMGVDFRLFEGNNTIGRDACNNICINNDPVISSHHATILYKKGIFYIRDEMTSNGTFVNGTEIDLERPNELSDNDIIKIGSTIFKFHIAE